MSRAGARTLIGGGGGCIFIYSGYARLISFEINFITKETSRAEPEYMNIHPPISVLAPALLVSQKIFSNLVKFWYENIQNFSKTRPADIRNLFGQSHQLHRINDPQKHKVLYTWEINNNVM